MNNPISNKISNEINTAVFLLLVACLGFQPITTDLYLATLPTLAQHFGVSARAIDSTLQIYLIAYALAQLITGPMSDRFGRRPILLGGIGLHIAASIGAMFASHLAWMNTMRGLQAVGVCCTVVCCRAIVRDSLEPKDGAISISKAMTWMGLIALLSPLTGGLIQMHFGWQSTFLFIAGFGLLSWLLAFYGYRETNRLMNARATHLQTLITNYLAILRHRRFILFTLVAAGTYSGLIVFLAKSPAVLIQQFKLSPIQFGLCIACCTVGFISGTLIGRRVFARYGMQRTFLIGAIVSACASVTMFGLVKAGLNQVIVYVGLQVIFMVAHGILQPIAQAAAVSDFPEKAGAAGALMGFCIHTLAAIWLTIAGLLSPTLAWPSAVIAASLIIACAVFALSRLAASNASLPLTSKPV